MVGVSNGLNDTWAGNARPANVKCRYGSHQLGLRAHAVQNSKQHRLQNHRRQYHVTPGTAFVLHFLVAVLRMIQ